MCFNFTIEDKPAASYLYTQYIIPFVLFYYISVDYNISRVDISIIISQIQS